MIQLFYHPSPNPLKVALLLEEANLPYELVPIDTRKGEQHSPEFLKINPNGKTPAILDGDVPVFDSNAIMLYLADKYQVFLPEQNDSNRVQVTSWLMFIASGIGPYCGQAVHFKRFAPEPKEYAVNRYDFEAWRHWNIINEHLSTRTWMVVEQYSIVDMSLWGWARMIPFILGDDAWEKLPNIKRWIDAINARPAAQRAEALKSKFDFKITVDEDAKRHLFPSNARLGL